MVIKMIIFEFVLILSLGSVSRCFPSSKGDSNNDLQQSIPQSDADKSDIKKPPPQNKTMTNFLKKLDFDPNSFNLDYAGLHEFCNFSNWELNNTNLKTDVAQGQEENGNLGEFTDASEVYRFDHETETFEPEVGNEASPFQNEKSTESSQTYESVGFYQQYTKTRSSQKYKSPESYYQNNLSTSQNYYAIPKNESSLYETTPTSETENIERSFEKNPTADTQDTDQPDDGIFIRIVLILILMLQNIFLFVMVLFYRSMKKTNKKCVEQLRK